MSMPVGAGVLLLARGGGDDDSYMPLANGVAALRKTSPPVEQAFSTPRSARSRARGRGRACCRGDAADIARFDLAGSIFGVVEGFAAGLEEEFFDAGVPALAHLRRAHADDRDASLMLSMLLPVAVRPRQSLA